MYMLYVYQRRVYFFLRDSRRFYDSKLATRRIGEQKFWCLQFASSAHNVASEVMETFCIFVQIQYWYDMNDIVVVFYYLFSQKLK